MNESANVTNSSRCLAHRMHNAVIASSINVHTALAEQATLYTLPYVVMFISLAIGCTGHKILRPSLMFMAFCVGSVSALHVTYTYASELHNWNCDAMVVASIVLGALCALLLWPSRTRSRSARAPRPCTTPGIYPDTQIHPFTQPSVHPPTRPSTHLRIRASTH